MKNRATGSTLIIAGTTVGAGILALPMVSAQQGFVFASLTLLGLWIVALYGALLLLEVNLRFRNGASFSTLGKESLGRAGQWFINLCMVVLFYCLGTAYISGGSHFLSAGITQYFDTQLPHWLSALLFTVVLGGLVTWHTGAVDLANRLLLTLKMAAFFTVIFLLLPQVNITQLAGQSHNSRFIWLSIPIFFTAFGFHGSVPSIVKYVGHRPNTLQRIFVIGSAVPLVLYLLWEMVTLGILPQQGSNSFATLQQHHGTVADFISALAAAINQPWINAAVNFFTDVAMTTSFLGVTLGLFDFFADMLNAKKQVLQRIIAALITFLPPLLFALLYPRGFIQALRYAAIPLAFLAIILPAVMAWRTRKQTDTIWQVRGGKLALVLMCALGASIVLLSLMT